MIEGGYVEAGDPGFRIRPKGRRIGRLARALQRVLTGNGENG